MEKPSQQDFEELKMWSHDDWLYDWSYDLFTLNDAQSQDLL